MIFPYIVVRLTRRQDVPTTEEVPFPQVTETKDMYVTYKKLEEQLEFLHVQEAYIKVSALVTCAMFLKCSRTNHGISKTNTSELRCFSFVIPAVFPLVVPVVVTSSSGCLYTHRCTLAATRDYHC